MHWETEDEDGWWEFNTMTPGSESIRLFNTLAFREDASYTYISEAFLVELTGQDEEPEPDLSDVAWAIGWWKFELGYDYGEAIENNDPDHMKVTADVTFPNGTAFFGNFSTGHDLKIITSGEVKQQPFAIETNEGKNPLIANQLPIDIDLSDISIPGTMKWETEDEDGWWELDTMTPGSESLRVFKPSAFVEDASYTYVSEAFLVELTGQDEDPNPDVSDVAWAIGWWKFELGYDYGEAIENNDPDKMKVTGPVLVKAGSGFVGNFSTGHSLKINFPGALSVPSKAK